MGRKNNGRKNGEEKRIGKRRTHTRKKIRTRRWDGREVGQEE